MRTGIQLLSSALVLVVALYTSTGAHATETRIVSSAAVPIAELKPSAIDNLLSPRDFTRRQTVCSIPGGIICNSQSCCPPGSFCQLNNHLGPGCCPDNALNCNGGQACCPSNSFCCSFSVSPTGCCIITKA